MAGITQDSVQLKGVSELNGDEKELLDKVIPEYYEKVKNILNDLAQIEVHFKTSHTEGKRKKYDINVRVISPTTNVYVNSKSSEQAGEWNFSNALNSAFQNIEQQIKKTIEKEQRY